MMIRKITRCIGLMALAILPLVPSVSTAQNNERSPYSRYGYGMLSPNTTAGSRAMGGLSVGLRDAYIINPGNPASYSAVDSLTFIMDVAVSLRNGWIAEGKRSDARTLGNLEYMTILMPLGRSLAMSAGIMPWATTGYRFGSPETLSTGEDGKTSVRTYSGEGTYNNLYLGFSALTPLKGLSIGANASFLFGVNAHERRVIYSTPGAINPVFTDRMDLRGFKFDFGTQYEIAFGDKGQRSLTLGVTASLPTSLSVEEQENRLAINSATGNSIVLKRDTITTNGHYTLPLSLGFGASYRIQDKMLVGADLRYSQWSSAKYRNQVGKLIDQEGVQIGQLADTYSLALGAEILPSARSRSIFKRARYRFGLSFGQGHMKIALPASSDFAGYQELGASLGMALPLVDMRSFLNLAVNYKYLSPQRPSMIREHYLGITLGLTFNEAWFRKARVH